MERNELFWAGVFDQMAQEDYVVIDNFLKEELVAQVMDYFHQQEEKDVFQKAAIGSAGNELVINEVRGDYTYWLDQQRDLELAELFAAFDEVKSWINRLCFLSLSDYEFHLAHYPKGSFYKRHLDQFSERNNRMISMIIYLNKGWKNGDGGELRIYPENAEAMNVEPLFNRCVLFRSDTLEHEVLTAHTDRRSVTGWMLYQPSIIAAIRP